MRNSFGDDFGSDKKLPMSAIDLEKLLQEISADKLCGEDLEYDSAFGKLERSATGKAEQQIGDTIVEAEEPDWQKVLKQSITLTSRTKDLRILIYLIRAALHVEGYTGLRDGLVLLQGLLEKYWEPIYPLLDEEDNSDPIMRINALSALYDDQAMLHPVRIAPLVNSRVMGRYSMRDYAIAHGDITPMNDSEIVEMQSINAAFMDADVEGLQTTASAIQESIDSLISIENFLTDRVGASNAVSLSDIGTLLKDARRILSEQLAQRGVGVDTGAEVTAETKEETGEMADTGSTPKTAPPISGAINSREDVIRALGKIQAYYERNEPSSPIPLLMKRAKSMVNMDFMEIIQNIAPDGVSQVEIIRGP